MDINMSHQINKCKTYINFVLSQQQWSGLTQESIKKWLSNFQDLEEKDLLLIYKLLTKLIVYSENDIIEALVEGVHKCLFYKIQLEQQISSNFTLSAHALQNIVKGELRKTCFIPLLHDDRPYESANNIARMLVQQGLVKQENVMFMKDIIIPFQERFFSRLVIIDDCIGSGDQLREFWLDSFLTIGNQCVSLSDFCRANGIEVNYLVLFGYDISIEKLREELPKITINCVRQLTDRQRVFLNNFYVWESEAELMNAINLFERVVKSASIPLRGYRDLDFAFVMHKTIPDWSLPIFWTENPDWELLLRRKNSNGV